MNQTDQISPFPCINFYCYNHNLFVKYYRPHGNPEIPIVICRKDDSISICDDQYEHNDITECESVRVYQTYMWVETC